MATAWSRCTRPFANQNRQRDMIWIESQLDYGAPEPGRATRPGTTSQGCSRAQSGWRGTDRVPAHLRLPSSSYWRPLDSQVRIRPPNLPRRESSPNKSPCGQRKHAEQNIDPCVRVDDELHRNSRRKTPIAEGSEGSPQPHAPYGSAQSRDVQSIL